MSWQRIAGPVSVSEIAPIEEVYYDGGHGVLMVVWASGDAEEVSVDLTGYGYVAGLGCAFIRPDENGRIIDALIAAGVVTEVDRATFGPFHTEAVRVEVCI